jgi:hypothetical protein
LLVALHGLKLRPLVVDLNQADGDLGGPQAMDLDFVEFGHFPTRSSDPVTGS